MDKIWEEVKANSEKLSSCNLHDFSIEIKTKAFPEWKCKNCKGKVDGVRKKWFEDGYRQGRRQHAKEIEQAERMGK